MPQHKSCAKRIKTSEKSRLRNRAIRSRVRGAVKAFETAETGDPAALRKAQSELDLAVKKGVLPKPRADRKKSRLARALARKNAAAASS